MKQLFVLDLYENKENFEQRHLFIFIKELLKCLEINDNGIFKSQDSVEIKYMLRELFNEHNIHIIDNEEVFQMVIQEYIAGTFHKPKYIIKNINGKNKLVAEIEISTAYD
jgi:5-formaminoimidazole-4-carboxamide-1-beta-D-ribofuranosyl 5'-monophosphate synthetase